MADNPAFIGADIDTNDGLTSTATRSAADAKLISI